MKWFLRLSAWFWPLCVIMAMCGQSLAADSVQIGYGTIANQGLPFEPCNNFSYTQQLYYASEIGGAGYISAIAFQYQIVSTVFLNSHNEFKLYMGHSSRSTLNQWIPLDSLSVVFDGFISAQDFSGPLPGQGWLMFTLANPFYFNGIDNLIIACDENTDGLSSTSDDFLASTSEFPMAVLYKSNTINPDPQNPPSETEPGYFVRQYRANLILEIEQEHLNPHSPQPEHNEPEVANTQLTLHWQSDAGLFDLFLGTDPNTLEQIGNQLTSTSYTLESNLNLLTTYHWQVIAYQSDQVYHGPVWQFTTAGETISAPQNLTGIALDDHARLTWQPPQAGTVVEYEIYRNNQYYDRTPELLYEDYALVTGPTYYYYIKAINHLNQVSPPSNMVSVTLHQTPGGDTLDESFETLPAFSTTIPGWLNLDLDASVTWAWEDVNYPNEGDPLAWMVFDPSQTVPPLTGLNPHHGSKVMLAMSAINPPSNDWLITPRCFLGSDPVFKFWAKSHTSDYGLERLRVLLSTTDASPESFVEISPPPHITVPVEWTEYSFDLSEYANTSAYLALNCVSWDAFALFVDSVKLEGENAYVSVNEHVYIPSPYYVYPNPNPGRFSLYNPQKESLEIRLFDLRGRTIYQARDIGSFDSNSLETKLAAGIYFLRIRDKRSVHTLKFLVLR